MVDLFIQETPKSLVLIEKFTKERKYEELGNIAHKIKPSFDMLEVSVFDKVVQLEKLSKEREDWEILESLVKSILEVSFKVIKDLEN